MIRPRFATGIRSAPKDRGAAIVELGVMLPLLVLLLFGIVEFGRGYNAKVTLTHAAREAVREYTIHKDVDDAVAAGEAAASGLSGTVTIDVVDDCDSTDGDTAEVEASWDLNYTIPLFDEGTITLDESAVMRCGG